MLSVISDMRVQMGCSQLQSSFAGCGGCECAASSSCTAAALADAACGGCKAFSTDVCGPLLHGRAESPLMITSALQARTDPLPCPAHVAPARPPPPTSPPGARRCGAAAGPHHAADGGAAHVARLLLHRAPGAARRHAGGAPRVAARPAGGAGAPRPDPRRATDCGTDPVRGPPEPTSSPSPQVRLLEAGEAPTIQGEPLLALLRYCQALEPGLVARAQAGLQGAAGLLESSGDEEEEHEEEQGQRGGAAAGRPAWGKGAAAEKAASALGGDPRLRPGRVYPTPLDLVGAAVDEGGGLRRSPGLGGGSPGPQGWVGSPQSLGREEYSARSGARRIRFRGDW